MSDVIADIQIACLMPYQRFNRPYCFQTLLIFHEDDLTQRESEVNLLTVFCNVMSSRHDPKDEAYEVHFIFTGKHPPVTRRQRSDAQTPLAGLFIRFAESLCKFFAGLQGAKDGYPRCDF